MRGSRSMGLALGMMVAATTSARSETRVLQDISIDTVWNAVGNPYVVGEFVRVIAGATLTIEPDVVIHIDPGQSIIIGDSDLGPGALVARGSADAPILFTSSVAAPQQPQPGDWTGLVFSRDALDAVFSGGEYQSGSILQHVVLEYAGAGDAPAVEIDRSSPYLDACEIRHSGAAGIDALADSGPPLLIEHCTIWDCGARGPGPGIILTHGAGHILRANDVHDCAGPGVLVQAGNSTFQSNTITGNASSWGGGMWFDESSNCILANNHIRGNVADHVGGGLYFSRCRNTTLNENDVVGNIAADAGGGIALENGSSHCDLESNTVYGNSAAYAGGGVAVITADSSTLTNNVVGGNSVVLEGGAGVYFYDSDGATLIGNSISGNTADEAPGGGLYFYNSSGCTLNANTVIGNHAMEGGGAYFGASAGCALLGNAIVGNSAVATQTGGIYATGGANLSLTADPNRGPFNTLCSNSGYQLYNDNVFDSNGSGDIDARYVRWCLGYAKQIRDAVRDHEDDPDAATIFWSPFVALLPGDLNCDGAVNFGDINPFIVALGGQESYEAQYPNCCWAHADCNDDGSVTAADINRFVALLSIP